MLYRLSYILAVLSQDTAPQTDVHMADRGANLEAFNSTPSHARVEVGEGLGDAVFRPFPAQRAASIRIAAPKLPTWTEPGKIGGFLQVSDTGTENMPAARLVRET